MCNQSVNTAQTAAEAGKSRENEAAISQELQVANMQLQLAQTRANAEYNASPAGQIQRQFESLQRCAKPYAESTIVPTMYRGNIGNCVIARSIPAADIPQSVTASAISGNSAK